MSNKVRLTVEVNVLTGDYEFKFQNLTNPGEGIDYSYIRHAIDQILLDLGKKVEAKITGTTKQ